ncbi:MAG TPA: ABC transporter permease [Desulfobacterales bacterium]|nr:ABC transporter permease [Desulfobacterales bacterium]
MTTQAAATVGRRPRMPTLLRALARDRGSVVGLAIVVVVALAAIGADWLTPFAAQGLGEPNVVEKLQPPSWPHVLGTDELGRDVLARIMFGGRASLAMALLVVLMGVAVGVPLGATAGYFGGWIDEGLMRLTDIFLAFPPLLLAIVVATALGPGFASATIALGITWWPWYARLARSQAASLRSRPFVEAAQVIGVRAPWILGRHIVPNLTGPILVQATLDLSAVILVGSGLSFLGLGVQPPTADWGTMVNAGRTFFLGFPWYATFPGLTIVLVSVGFVLLGDGLRRALQLRPADLAR